VSPERWLVDNQDLLPPRGRALDLACGRGRHALWLAQAGYDTVGLDHDAETVASLNAEAMRLGIPLRAEVVDLEAPGASLGTDAYDVIVVVNYLHRQLFPALVAALRPGGVLVYETMTVDQAARGKPTNPDFLLKHGELPVLVRPLRVLRFREGEANGRLVASVVATKTADRVDRID
jgi:SAM-dependent methyltransferase